MEYKIMTLHPEEGKQGVNIARKKYDMVRAAILNALDRSELTFSELTRHVENQLGKTFDGSIPWYVTTVKLDLEARGEIERVPRSRPQRLRLLS